MRQPPVGSKLTGRWPAQRLCHPRDGQVLRISLVVLTAVVIAGLTCPLEGVTIDSVAGGAGLFNYARDDPEFELGVELRFPPKKWKIGAMTGVAATDQGAVYTYGV